MKKVAMLLSLGFFTATLAASYAQESLADLAKREEERREEVQNSRIITSADVAKYRRGTPESDSLPVPPETPERPESESAKRAESADPDEPTDFEGRPESYWRKTMAEARQKVKNLENEANVIVLRIAELQNKFYSMDDGFNRETVQRDVQKSYYEQDLNKANLEKARAALQDLENEARKSGALPGWLAE